MLKSVDIKVKLDEVKVKHRSEQDELLNEAKQILQNDIVHTNKVLDNLTYYFDLKKLIDEEDCDKSFIFSKEEIKCVAINYRLRFVDSKFYRSEFPYEAILKIKDINVVQKKEIEGFKVLAPLNSIKNLGSCDSCLLFAPTNHGNYYLIHQWGNLLKPTRGIYNWPLRQFENLFITLLVVVFIVTLCLPNSVITLNVKNLPYWSGYRIATFFHLLIFSMGVTAYYTFAFSKNFSSSVWNSHHDFDA
jgi:hypothetical protein